MLKRKPRSLTRVIRRSAPRQAAPAQPQLGAGPEAALLQLQRLHGNQQVSRLLVQRFYVESDDPKGYTWVDDDAWDKGKYEISPNSKLTNGWFFHNLYRLRNAPPQQNQEAEPVLPKPESDVKPKPNAPELLEQAKAPEEIEEHKEPEKLEAIKESEKTPKFSGVVIFERGDFYVNHPQHGKIKVDAGSFRIAVDTEIEYQVVQPNRFFTKAVVTYAGERPKDTSVNEQLKQARDNRTQAVQNGQLLKPQGIKLVGQLNSSGARKHYGDKGAIATSDQEVYQLLSHNLGNKNYQVSPTNDTEDQFTIDFGKDSNSNNAKMSIIGSIVYADPQKTVVKSVVVFHVGPSQ